VTVYRLTERDQTIAAWLERVPWVEVSQLARRFAMHEAKAYERLRALRGAGLVEHVRLWHGRPGAYYAGRAPGPREYDHDHAVTEALIDAERPGLETTSEREMRRAEAFSRERTFSVPLGASGNGAERFHRPDFIVEDGTDVAVEVELSAKGRARLERILAAYVRQTRYERVLYLVPEGARQTAVALEGLAHRAGGAGIIEVRGLHADPVVL